MTRSPFGGWARGLPFLNAVLAMSGAVINAATLDNVAGLIDRTVGNFTVVLLPFVGFGILAVASRHDTKAAVATCLAGCLAVALAVYWFTEPFGEFTGLFGLLVIPLQMFLWLVPAIRLWVRGRRGRLRDAAEAREPTE